LICLLVAEGVAITHSYIWAAPLVCILLVAVAADLPIAPLVGMLLLVRVLTDDESLSTSRHSAALNLSGIVAVVLILVATGLLVRRRQRIGSTLVIGLWLLLWTTIAAISLGLSTISLREGVRETSIVALAVIVYNARGAITVSVVTRMLQVVGVIPAVLAIYQLGTHSGLDVGGQIRANGTFAQPNSAVVFFAIVAIASLWRYTDGGRHWADAVLMVLYGVAALATFSITGVASLLVMLFTFGLLAHGSFGLKLGSVAVAVVLVGAFIATPLGADRLASESSTTLSATHVRGASSNSLEWRLYKWQTLIPEWERAPLFGRGLGTTTNGENGTFSNPTTGDLPHSEYVRYLVETGILGLISVLAGSAVLIQRLRRQRAIALDRTALLGIALVVGLLVDALTANTLLYTPAAYAAALIVAAVLRSGVDSSRAPDIGPKS